MKEHKDTYFVRSITIYQVLRANVGGDVFVIDEYRTKEAADYAAKGYSLGARPVLKEERDGC